ncbi:MAG TPA: alpha/beta hydrolase [Acidimicrobiia bacterium]|jgi:pimeloyl-ACP methyl ester carboxylesterase
MAGLGDSTTRFVSTDDGVPLAVAVREPDAVPGAGGVPSLLLVHGFGGAKEDFADHVDALAEQRRVVSFDHRGHGASGAPDRLDAYSLDRLAADVIEVADALEVERFHLLGHSLGGMVARRVVLADPERVDAIVFMDTSAGPPPGIDPDLVRVAAEVALRDGMPILRKLLEELDPLGSPAHERVLAKRPGFEAYGDRKWASLSPFMWAALATEMFEQPDELSQLVTIDVPALVLVGDQDETFLGPSAAIADAVPGARLVVVPDAGHSPQFENPSAWYEALHLFLAGLPGTPGPDRVRLRRPSPGSDRARR